MANTLAEARPHPGQLDVPAWKSIVSVSAAVLVALLFLVAGIWKLTEPFEAATRMMQARVPGQLSLFTALFMGVAETFGIPNARLCKALLDRITDRAHILETGTESYRFRRTMERQKKATKATADK